jgi:cobalamin biosynthetic protein CobC
VTVKAKSMGAADLDADPVGVKVYHGGDLAAAASRFPRATRPWLDLSSGINPVPYPVGDLSPACWARLPQSSDVRGLEHAAALAYGARDTAMVVAAPGAQALIQWLPRLRSAKRVGILGFTFAEHQARWQASGAKVEIVSRLEALEAFDVAVIVNPNNPDGRLVPQDGLMALVGRLARHGGLLIVDEAFMDARPTGDSLVPKLPREGAVVLRSFGKLYGLAGLRLGFLVASPSVAMEMRDALGAWAVSGPAVEIGRKALADGAWREQALARLNRDAARLDALLGAAGFAIEGGTLLFRLARHADAAGWFARLGEAGILVRPFAEQQSWLRFGLPSAQHDWRRLVSALGIHDRGSATSYPNSAADASSQDQKLPARERMTDIS